MGSQFEPGRAIEVTAPKYGSAYRVGGRLVLTAAHLLGEVGSDCRVRAKQSFGVVAAKVVWKAKNADIALIELPESVPPCDPVVLGRLPEGKAGEKIAFQMYGYPLWARTKRDEGKSAAGGRQIEGTIYLADCSPDGLLVLEAERRPPEVTTAESEWEGASGGAIVCDGVVIAVQSQHQNPNRPASLEAAPLVQVYDDEQWRKLLHQHSISPKLQMVQLDNLQTQSISTPYFLQQSDQSWGQYDLTQYCTDAARLIGQNGKSDSTLAQKIRLEALTNHESKSKIPEEEASEIKSQFSKLFIKCKEYFNNGKEYYKNYMMNVMKGIKIDEFTDEVRQALNELQKSIDLNDELTSSIYMEMAQDLFDQKQQSWANLLLEEAAKLDRDKPKIYETFAIFSLCNRDYSKALLELNKAKKLFTQKKSLEDINRIDLVITRIPISSRIIYLIENVIREGT